NFFFSDRGAFRLDDVTATDVGLNYSLPLGKMSFFAQGDIINVLNEDAQINARTTILTAFNAGGLETFNPFTETPVEGVHWRKSTTFGTATGPADYQLPRTYRLSVGFKF